jgi:hypothetical protein
MGAPHCLCFAMGMGAVSLSLNCQGFEPAFALCPCPVRLRKRFLGASVDVPPHVIGGVIL